MYLSKILRSFPKSLSYTIQRGFAGGHGHTSGHGTEQAHGHGHGHEVASQGHGHGQAQEHGHDPHHSAPIINEISDEELSRFNYLYPRPTKHESILSFHNIISKFPLTKSKAFLQFMVENFQENKSESNVENYVPPKVHENSVFLYQSKDLANELRQVGATEIAGAIFVAALMHNPFFALPTFGAFYYIIGRAYFYELRRRTVTRMDLLPHLEMVQIQKTALFGQVYSKLVRIDDLEKVDFEEVSEKENYFWGVNKTHIDQNLIFRDKSTGEYLCFDKQGYWNWKGISHELLN